MIIWRIPRNTESPKSMHCRWGRRWAWISTKKQFRLIIFNIYWPFCLVDIGPKQVLIQLKIKQSPSYAHAPYYSQNRRTPACRCTMVIKVHPRNHQPGQRIGQGLDQLCYQWNHKCWKVTCSGQGWELHCPDDWYAIYPSGNTPRQHHGIYQTKVGIAISLHVKSYLHSACQGREQTSNAHVSNEHNHHQRNDQ